MPVTKKHWVDVSPDKFQYAVKRAQAAMRRLDNAKDKIEREQARRWWAAWMTRTGIGPMPPKEASHD